MRSILQGAAHINSDVTTFLYRLCQSLSWSKVANLYLEAVYRVVTPNFDLGPVIFGESIPPASNQFRQIKNVLERWISVSLQVNPMSHGLDHYPVNLARTCLGDSLHGRNTMAWPATYQWYTGAVIVRLIPLINGLLSYQAPASTDVYIRFIVTAVRLGQIAESFNTCSKSEICLA